MKKLNHVKLFENFINEEDNSETKYEWLAVSFNIEGVNKKRNYVLLGFDSEKEADKMKDYLENDRPNILNYIVDLYGYANKQEVVDYFNRFGRIKKIMPDVSYENADSIGETIDYILS